MQSISLRTRLLAAAIVLAPIIGCGAQTEAQARSTHAEAQTPTAQTPTAQTPTAAVQTVQPSVAASAATPAPVARTYTKPSDAVLRQKLTPLQYSVTQNADTETPFQNQYWDNHAAGIYVDIVSGEPLFSSKDKFHSGTGWPSFTRPLEPKNIHQDTDTTLGFERIEIRSAHANSHLGHLFHDGPQPTGLRYCMNSASLRFVPASQLAAEGYSQYASLFR